MKREYTHTPLEVAEGILSGKYTITSVYVLVNQIEDLTRERDEARAEVERLRGDAQAIAAIAHTGGTAGLSEHEALVEIRRRTLKAWDGRTSREALEAKP